MKAPLTREPLVIRRWATTPKSPIPFWAQALVRGHKKFATSRQSFEDAALKLAAAHFFGIPAAGPELGISLRPIAARSVEARL